jgi:hypothetical protein
VSRLSVFSQNWGKGREIIDQQRIHRSVYNRLAYEKALREAKSTIIEEVKAEIKKKFSMRKKSKGKKAEAEVYEWPKAGFADGTTWEQVLDLPDDDDIWEFVKPVEPTMLR